MFPEITWYMIDIVHGTWEGLGDVMRYVFIIVDQFGEYNRCYATLTKANQFIINRTSLQHGDCCYRLIVTIPQ